MATGATLVSPVIEASEALRAGSEAQSSKGEITAVLFGSKTFNPASLVDAAGETTSLTVTGAALGDFCVPAFSLDLQDILLTAYVQAANTVEFRFQNEGAATVDLASGTLSVLVFKGRAAT